MRSRWGRIAPIVSLLLLAPIISELLYGAVRVSTIFILIPEVMTWGCSALLIRESIRRWNQDWRSQLLLGVALAILEEWVMQQTSISPLVGVRQHGYARVWGVNWAYFLWAVGHESVWVVLIPVQLTELLFWDRRGENWLRPRGLLITGIVFLVGAVAAWYGWTQRARVAIFHMAPYSPPLAYILIGLTMILLLILLAYVLPPRRKTSTRTPAPAPCIVGTVVCALAAPWEAFVIFGWGVGALPDLPFRPLLIVALFWTGLACVLMLRWTSAANWGDAHRFAVVFAGVLACILGGFVVFTIGGALRMDWIGKIVFNAAALAALGKMSRITRQREKPDAQRPTS